VGTGTTFVWPAKRTGGGGGGAQGGKILVSGVLGVWQGWFEMVGVPDGWIEDFVMRLDRVVQILTPGNLDWAVAGCGQCVEVRNSREGGGAVQDI
jgi:hypothetical protein